jgi:hypothetical protein
MVQQPWSGVCSQADPVCPSLTTIFTPCLDYTAQPTTRSSFPQSPGYRVLWQGVYLPIGPGLSFFACEILSLVLSSKG